MMKDTERILALSSAFGPSGYEDDVADLMESEVKDFCQCTRDTMGNLYMRPDGMKNPLVVLDAHMDEVGFMVSCVKENGMLMIQNLGGWNPVNVAGSPIRIRTEKGDVYGVVASRPPHYDKKGERPEMEDLLLDSGFCSADEVRKAGIEEGCFCVPDAPSRYNENAGVFEGKAFDCRIGCAALVGTLEALRGTKTIEHVEAVGTVQEEVGERGMFCAVNQLKAKAGICFEGCPADDTFMPADEIQTAMGKGPMVRIKDTSMITNRRFMRFVREVAGQENIPLQLAVRKGGGTNAIVLQEHNIPAVVIGIPVRYAHSGVGFCAYEDYQNAVKLACALCKRIDEFLNQA